MAKNQKTKQHEPLKKLGVIACVPEVLADPAPHVAPIVSLMLLTFQYLVLFGRSHSCKGKRL